MTVCDLATPQAREESLLAPLPAAPAPVSRAPVATPTSPAPVSVIIPTYNRAGFLPAALRSVLHQNPPPTEVIVIDDGSTDDTASVVAAFGGSVRYLRQDNAGPAAARNRGLKEATGDWIAFHDSDDLWVPDKLAVQLSFLQRYPQLDFSFGHLANFQGDDAPVGTAVLAPEILDPSVYVYLRDHAGNLSDLFLCLLRVNPIPTPTVLMRRSCLGKVGFFDEALRCCEDYEYWLRLALHCRGGFIDRVLVHRRMHEQNLIGNQVLRSQTLLEVLERVRANHPNLPPGGRHALERTALRTRYNLGSSLARQGRPEAVRYLSGFGWPALIHHPRAWILAPWKRFILRWRRQPFTPSERRS